MEVERIETTMVLFTVDPKKGFEWVDEKMNEGFEHVRTDSECGQYERPRFRMEVSKIEPFLTCKCGSPSKDLK